MFSSTVYDKVVSHVTKHASLTSMNDKICVHDWIIQIFSQLLFAMFNSGLLFFFYFASLVIFFQSIFFSFALGFDAWCIYKVGKLLKNKSIIIHIGRIKKAAKVRGLSFLLDSVLLGFSSRTMGVQFSPRSSPSFHLWLMSFSILVSRTKLKCRASIFIFANRKLIWIACEVKTLAY